ncbi:MAG: type III-B CRISPR module-associated Cmr3 family protein [Vulcanimicrobiaceae bacterium]
MTTFAIDALDTLFFRDGRPYRMGDADQSNVPSLFPPPPYTLVGALRAGLARNNGWDGVGRWNVGLAEILGDGPENLGVLSFRGPCLARNREPLYPAPGHLMRVEGGGRIEYGLLTIDPAARSSCDIDGATVLPKLRENDRARSGWRSAQHMFLTAGALRSVLAGAPPEQSQVVPAAELWVHERRTALSRDATRHATGEEGDLYSPAYARLKRGVTLLFDVEGIPETWIAPELVPLGGESRMAAIERLDDPLEIPLHTSMRATSDSGAIHFVFVCLTPLRLPLLEGSPVAARSGTAFFGAFGLPGIDLVSAAIERPIYLGGWDSLERTPLAMRPHLLPGSVLFCRCPPADFAQLCEDQPRGLGSDRRLGINQYTVGVIPTS